MAQAVASISNGGETFWLCFGAVEIKAPNPATLPPQRSWQKNGVTKMTEQLTSYDPAVALVDDEEMALFMADAFETGDATYIAKALGVVARAKGMTEIA